MEHSVWLKRFVALSVLLLLLTVGLVVYIDPFFHYHAPLTDRFYYQLNNKRSQNDGIARHFQYDAVLTGTSTIANSRTTEIDALFDVQTVKLPLDGSSLKETGDQLRTALRHNDRIRLVLRGLDISNINSDKDRADESNPIYLYNDNLFDDVYYILNKDVVFSRCLPMIVNRLRGEEPGVRDFDSYDNWMRGASFGYETVLEGRDHYDVSDKVIHLSKSDVKKARANIRQNIVDIANAYPDVTFVYFIAPVSVDWWGREAEKGTICRAIDAERVAFEEMLACDNIRLYSFNLRTEITTDLNNYKDRLHYGDWINTRIYELIAQDQCRITRDNYLAFLEAEQEYYLHFDYNSLFNDDYRPVGEP